jgi:DNA polymerase I-like protein with 3'-5' exonuclease and polymerase domains
LYRIEKELREEKDADKVCNLLAEEMKNAVSLSVELTADAAYGKNWLESKK